LRPCLREASDRIVLLTARDEELFALVPVDGADDRDELPDLERRARKHLGEGGRLAKRGKRFRLDDEALTLRELLETAEEDTAVFLTSGGRIRFVLVALDGPAGGRADAVSASQRPSRRDRDLPDEDDRPRGGREGRTPDKGMSTNEWVAFPILFLAVPMVNVILSSTLYYVWKDNHPRKATQINLLGFAVFGIHVLLFVGFMVLAAVLGDPPQKQQQGNLRPPGPPPENQKLNNDPAQGLEEMKPPEKADAASGLLAYWSFDEGRGGRPFNSGSGQPGEAANLHSCKWVAGRRGNAIGFNGESSWCDLIAGNDMNFQRGDDVAVSAWFQTKGKWGAIFMLRNGADGGPVVCLAVEEGRLVGIIREDRGEALGPALIKGPAVNDGEWHHALLSRSMADDQVKLHLDGKEIGSKQASTNGAAGAITTDLRALGSERYYVLKGQHQERQYFRGKIDEVCVYKRRLTAEEIGILAAAGKPPGSR
jgi:hypothetical protein